MRTIPITGNRIIWYIIRSTKGEADNTKEFDGLCHEAGFSNYVHNK